MSRQQELRKKELKEIEKLLRVVSTIPTVFQAKDIVDGLGLIEDKKPSKLQQIQFTYQFFSLNSGKSLAEIIECFENVQFDKDMDNTKDFFSRNIKSGAIRQANSRAFITAKWFWDISLTDKFHSHEISSPVVFKYMNGDGEITTIDENEGKKIYDELESRDVPCKRCIVDEAFRWYAQDSLSDFIDGLETGSLFEAEILSPQMVKKD